jgi:hypothetical protein
MPRPEGREPPGRYLAAPSAGCAERAGNFGEPVSGAIETKDLERVVVDTARSAPVCNGYCCVGIRDSRR